MSRAKSSSGGCFTSLVFFLCRALGVALLAAFIPSFAQSVRDTSLQVRTVVTGLAQPTNMAFIGTNDMLVTQKGDGRVRRVLNGVLQAGAVLDLAVDSASERGLLGIALHPAFASNRWVYFYYTESANGSDTFGTPTPTAHRVVRYTWNGSALTTPAPITMLPVTPGANHDGGIITFGPDGKLYIMIGDLNRNGRLQNNPSSTAVDDTSVILRLNADGSIPTDNPFSAQGGALAKYYAYGIRNSFGMTFDPVTGRLWDTENGPDRDDEINLVRPGFNSGWRPIMGRDADDPEGVANLVQVPGSQYSDPEFTWRTPVGVTAIAFLYSARLGAQYQNDAFVGDVVNGNLYRFEPNSARDAFVLSGALADLVANSATERDAAVFGSGFGGVTDIKVGPDGALYVLSIRGALYAIAPAGGGGGGGTTLSVSPASIAAGGRVTATWTGIASPTPTDWIGLHLPSAPSTQAIDWMYVSCSKTRGTAGRAGGNCPFTIPSTLAAGSYQLRLHAANGYTVLARSGALTVTTGGGGGGGTTLTLSVNPTSVAAGGATLVSWSNIATPTTSDWVGLHRPGAPSQQFIDWMYVNCTKVRGAARATGSCNFPIPVGLAAGGYEMRLHSNNGFTALKSTPLTVR